MKKILLLSSSLFAITVFADGFVIVVDQDQSDYKVLDYITEYTDWVDTADSVTNCTDYSPLASAVYEGASFSQTSNCQQPQTREEQKYSINKSTNEKKLVNSKIENGYRDVVRTLNEIGTYEASSCLDALNHQSATTNGYYNIKPNQNKLSVYCDMVNGGYTEYKMTSLSDRFSSDVEAKCEEENLQLFVPRTESHVEHAIKEHAGSYFRLMGIYPKTAGARCDTVYFNSEDCSNWTTKDSGKWFVYAWDMTYPHNGGGYGAYPEPNGDNSLNSSMAYGWDNTTGRVISLNDILNTNTSSLGGYTTRNWVCSAKDEKNI